MNLIADKSGLKSSISTEPRWTIIEWDKLTGLQLTKTSYVWGCMMASTSVQISRKIMRTGETYLIQILKYVGHGAPVMSRIAASKLEIMRSEFGGCLDFLMGFD